MYRKIIRDNVPVAYFPDRLVTRCNSSEFCRFNTSTKKKHTTNINNMTNIITNKNDKTIIPIMLIKTIAMILIIIVGSIQPVPSPFDPTSLV